ncbi:MAG: DUF1847 domain-containing protein [Gemmatimonadetes bacterium]|nr:DUF1847 domain-containing protein [Gemmatimonadota bacterium]
MRGDFPDFDVLYSEERSRELLIHSAQVEAEGYCTWTRLREVAEFARRMGFGKVGLPHCPDMSEEADMVRSRLQDLGLEGHLPPPSLGGDPSGQADYFAKNQFDLNLIAGMCVAHEALFLGATEAQTVSLIARDRRLHHNPAAGLYTSRSYLQKELFGHWPKDRRPEREGSGLEGLRAVSLDTECSNGPIRSRVAEAMDFAQAVGASHIGVSFCVGFREEAKTLSKILDTNGFQVSSACCKAGAVPKERAGIRDDQKVTPGKPEMVCNPIGQATLLNRDQAEFVLVLGQCVGHDAATLAHLQAPAAVLVAKDRVLAHNTVAALYSPQT